MSRLLFGVALVLLGLPDAAAAQARVDKNVVYGSYSGLALLMDVYRPTQPNGKAVLAIGGSGWYSPLRYDATALNASQAVVDHAQRFTASGYTVFAISHRQAPRFHYPAPIDDAQRAVRFVRFHAAEYGITSDRVGAWGSSSGGHLVGLLATLDGKGDPADSDPVNRLSAKVQAAVTLFGPVDLPALYGAESSLRRIPATLTALMGFAYQDPTVGGSRTARPDDLENRAYREASPLTHVTRDDPPMLLIHGDQDVVVPIAQSEAMELALKAAGVPVRFIRVKGGQHGPDFQIPAGDPRLPDHKGEAVRWFDAHLK